MSLGDPSDSSVFRDASYWAYQQGVIQIVVAGNSGDVAYPARYSWVIAVTAVDQNYNVPA
jgi:subtilisin